MIVFLCYNAFCVKSITPKNRQKFFFFLSILTGFLLFIGSLFANYTALKYATRDAGNFTTDILLDRLPVINTDIIFSEGALFFVIFVVFLLFLNPQKAPFVLKGLALFIYVRSLFVVMTHLAPSPERISTDLESLKYLSSSADLFFSGHTGVPFFLGLLFWKEKGLRFFFIGCSVIAAVSVLLGHLHYTIDVFSAYFISYGIAHIARVLFPRDFKMFLAKKGEK